MHPLLESIQIQNLESATEMKDAIEQRGLLVKYDNDFAKLVVKYPDNLRYSSDPSIRKSRGIIIDTHTKSVVCPSFEGAISFDKFKRVVPWTDVVIERSYDGTMYNVYNDNGVWRLATKFHLRPENNHYRSEKSFFDLFNDAITFESLCEVLDPECSYVFLLCHPENRNVTPYTVPELYHIETSHVKTGERIFTRVVVGEKSIPTCDVLQYCGRAIKISSPIVSYDEISDYVSRMHWSQRGVMLYSKDRQYRCHIVNPRFENVRAYVGGNSSFEYICLKKIKNEIDDDQWSQMINYYPELDRSMVRTLGGYNGFVKAIHELYVRMRIRHETVEVPKEWRILLYSIHTDYLNNRHGVLNEGGMILPNPSFAITVEFIAQKLLSYDTKLIYSWIKSFFAK
jgi:hypothetical protein